MKKVVLFTAAMLLMAFQANAQLTADAGYIHAFENAKISYDMTTLTGKEQITETGKASLDGFYVGAKYGISLYGITEGLSLKPGANVSFLFGKEEGITDVMSLDSKTTVVDVALNIPLHVEYAYEVSPDFKISAFAGPTFQCGLLNRAIDGDQNPSYIYNQYKTVPHGIRYVNELGVVDEDLPARNRINLYLGLGVGFEIAEKVQVNFGFDFGVLNLSSGDKFKIHRNQLKVGLGYIF